jgi:hypothetical protein
MFGALFGRAKAPAPPVSNPDVFASFLLAQFLPEFQWQIPKTNLDEWVRASGPEFEQHCRMWILIYCAWLFRGAIIYRYGEQFQKDVMTALRVRLAKLDPQKFDPMMDLPRLLEFWYPKLDAAVDQSVKAKPKSELDSQSGVVYGAAVSFIALGTATDSPWYKNPDVPHALIVQVAVAIAEAHERMQPQMLGIVDIVSKPSRK